MTALDLAQRDKWNNRLKAIALGIGLALTLLTLRHWYETFSFGHPLCDNCRPDFPSLYSGAKLIWAEPGSLYDLNKQLAIQKSIDARIGDSVLAFAYPPLTALLLMPLGWLSFPGAYLGMTVVNAMALLLALKLLVNHLQLNRQQTGWLWLTTLCNFGVHSTLLQGQTSLFALLLATFFMGAARRGEEGWAGAWSGALFIKPQLMAVPVLALATRRQWRGVGFALLVIGAAAIFSALLVGQQGMADYFRVALRFTSAGSDLGSNPMDMHNLRALAYYSLPAPVAWSGWILSSVLVAVAVCLLNTKSYQGERAAAAQWIGTLAAMLLLSPHLHAHDLALLVLPSAWVLKLFPAVPCGIVSLLIAVGILPMLPIVLSTHLLPVLPLIFLTAMALALRQVWRSN